MDDCDALSTTKVYEIKILNFFNNDEYIIYQASIKNFITNTTHTIHFRYRTLKRFHSKLVEKLNASSNKKLIPQFPKTNSFFLFNRTNKNLKLLMDRKKELEYYLNTIMNMTEFRGSKFVKNLLRQGTELNENNMRRSRSQSSCKDREKKNHSYQKYSPPNFFSQV